MKFDDSQISAIGRTRRLAWIALLWLLTGTAHGGIGEQPGDDWKDSAGPEPVAERCALSPQAAELLTRIQNHPAQRRRAMHCSRQLAAFAEMRARDMARRGYFSHVTPGRKGPNALLDAFGYPLPDVYGGGLANGVESIAAGWENVEDVFRELLASRVHRRHLLAEAEFFERQDEVGIAHFHDPDSEFQDYWVIVIARRQRPDEPRYLCTPAPATCFQLTGHGR